MGKEPRKRKVLVLKVAVIVFFAVLFSAGAVFSTPAIVFFNVTVSGTATGRGSIPLANVTFVDENGLSYSAPVGASGGYSITLQNGHFYSAYIVYTATAGAAGNCTAGTLNLDALSYTQTFNPSC